MLNFNVRFTSYWTCLENLKKITIRCYSPFVERLQSCKSIRFLWPLFISQVYFANCTCVCRTTFFSPFYLGKSGLKLFYYMEVGLPWQANYPITICFIRTVYMRCGYPKTCFPPGGILRAERHFPPRLCSNKVESVQLFDQSHGKYVAPRLVENGLQY